jgi:F-type H+-transporting ATPase subunit b
MTEFGIINFLLTAAAESQNEFNWRFASEHAVNLLILLLVLVYFMKGPVKNFLVERRNSIGHEIDVAEKTITEARARYDEYSKRLEGIEKEIGSIKESLRTQGEKERNEILRVANAASENMKKEAADSITLQTERAKREIQSEVADLALAHAKSLIAGSLGAADRERMISDFTKNIEDEKWHQSQH